MATVWLPGIWIDGTSTWYPLPKPVESMDEAEGPAMRLRRVPGADGGLATDKSKGTVEIRVTGRISRDGSGTLLSTEASILSEIDTFRTRARGGSTAEFWFMTHYDSGSSTYRYYKECLAQRLRFGTIRADLFVPYELVVVALDPTIYTAAAGNLT